jgi:murein L,D-transpeptidase YcbB/YkuD
MRGAAIIGLLGAALAGAAWDATAGAAWAQAGPVPLTPAVRPAPAAAAKPATAARADKPTPASRSAAALAASSDPTFDEDTFQRLKEALLSYSALQVRGGWPQIPSAVKLAPGATGPQVALLRRRLAITEDLPPDQAEGDAYDEATAEGVKRFQLRHGLAPTGSVGPQTLAALNVPVATRLRQLQGSLERLAGVDFMFGDRYVVVNIPAAVTEAVADDKVERRNRVVVGKVGQPSPTLTTFITAVVVNPTWTVPLSITKNEIIGKMRKDPSYLSRMRMRVLDARNAEIDPRTIDWSSTRSPNFTIRQDSGPGNALGTLKIDMPNPYSVYMHDTNLKNLFDSDYRFDSHGCTRVDHVRDLAAWILQETRGWDIAALDAAIARGQRQDIRLARKIPVAWVYLTGWMTRDGTVQFRDDVYNRDSRPPTADGDSARAALVDARAGGFVQPPPRIVTQASHLDSR